MLERVKLPPERIMLLPDWEGPFEGWSRKWAQKQEWRVRYIIGDYEDCVQHCAMIFARVCHTYKHVVRNHAHLMSLYKIAVRNEWATLSRNDGRRKAMLDQYYGDLKRKEWMHSPGEAPEAPLRLDLQSLSREAKEVLDIVLDAPSDTLKTIWESVSPFVRLEISNVFDLKIKIPTHQRNPIVSQASV